ncbi:hypothetical protein ABMC89_03240 [Sulfitobacter sp. HNIBRBA3233]|uniref:hypothetical protein n=1 Tax=Sulfitobacter marinivivus TaxID=3158558 RepID=UPI0032E02EBD
MPRFSRFGEIIVSLTETRKFSQNSVNYGKGALFRYAAPACDISLLLVPQQSQRANGAKGRGLVFASIKGVRSRMCTNHVERRILTPARKRMLPHFDESKHRRRIRFMVRPFPAPRREGKLPDGAEDDRNNGASVPLGTA